MRRREFIAGLGSTTVWPVVGRAQQIDRTRRVGVLMGWSEGNSEYRSYLAAFIEELAALGWPTGSLQIEQRWTDGNIDRARILAKQIVELQPDVILSATTPVTTAVQRETRAVPVVFVVVSDPVGAGFTESLSRPGGNFTGFINIEASMVGKQLGILKEIAPDIKRALIMFNPDTAPGAGRYFLDSFRIAAQSLEIEPIEVQVRSDFEIESAIHLIRERTGLVVMTDSFMGVHLGTVISSEARNIVPAIFEGPQFARSGGLVSYGPNYLDMFRRAAGYVNRILRGVKPSDLPVEVPTKFDLVLNLKTAKALGLTIPETLLATADEVIE